MIHTNLEPSLKLHNDLFKKMILFTLFQKLFIIIFIIGLVAIVYSLCNGEDKKYVENNRSQLTEEIAMWCIFVCW